MSRENEYVVQLCIALCETDPIVWRRVHVPTDFRMRRLHDVIQAVFAWTWSHLHIFVVGDDERAYGPREIIGDSAAGIPLSSDRNVKLADLLRRGYTRIGYIYDLGDEWQHLIEVESLFTAQPGTEYPIYVEGEKQAPPEDCGGPPGFSVIMDVLEGKEHPDRANILDLYGDFDPDDIAVDRIEGPLTRIRRSRRKGPAKGSRQSGGRVWTRR